MKHEYSDYTGDEKYGIITGLTETELEAKYGSLLNEYRPFIVLDLAFAEVRNEYNRNEWKYDKRASRSLSYGIDDEDFGSHHAEISVPDCLDQLIENEEHEKLWSAIKKLTPLQQQRLIHHYFEGVSIRKIAEEEGTDHKTVLESMTAAVKKLKKFL